VLESLDWQQPQQQQQNRSRTSATTTTASPTLPYSITRDIAACQARRMEDIRQVVLP
jgi:hypothetical protein